MSDVLNPRAVPGSNEAPDYAREVTDRMASEYAELFNTVDNLLVEANKAPVEVNDDETMGVLARIVKRLRDVATRAEAIRQNEKQPYLRSCDAIDALFFGLIDKCARRKKTDKVGAADKLQARIDIYNQRKAAEERRRREEEFRRVREAEEAARKQREDAERMQREAEQAAARARKAENVAEHVKEAQKHQTEANIARDAERQALDLARDAGAAATAKTADLVRTRLDDGITVTMKQEPYVEILDASKLDHSALWPFIKEDHLLQAVKRWGAVTQYKRQMEGAIIEMRDVTVIK